MTSKQWQLAQDAATRYEEILVPAILGPFAKALVDWAKLQSDDVVVDVGCGTGSAARFAAQQLESSGKVVGVDVNEGMLAVAQSLPAVQGAPIAWLRESAYAFSLDDASVDVVLCAQVLQFLTKRHTALTEMRRILKPGQSAYISLWCEIEQSPYFDALVDAIARRISPDTAAGLGSAFNLSKLDEIEALVNTAGFSDIETTVSQIDLALPPIAEFVPRHIGATPMGPGYQAASSDIQQAILNDLSERLAEYTVRSGVRVPFRSYLVKATK